MRCFIVLPHPVSDLVSCSIGAVRLANIGPRSYYMFVACLALAALPAMLRAQIFTATTGMPVRIELVGFCNVSAADLDFGAYASNQSAPAQGQTNIQLLCSGGAVAELRLD